MKKITTLFAFLLLLNGCSKDDNSGSNENIEVQTIEGKVILPEGSTLDLNNLSVQSYNGNSSISSDSYIINIAEDNHNFLFVSDANDKVILMGYNYPGQTNFDINAESTIIALAMSMPIASLLTDAAKVDFVNKLRQNSNFYSVVSKMETLIENGISPLDTNQEVFLNEFLSLFENAVTSKTSKVKVDYNEDPVNIIKAGNKITFVNGGKTYETSIGIYKNDKRIEYLELDRVQFFATSTSEALNTANNLATANFDGTEIEQKTYEFKEDGEYQIKIGTGFNTDFTSYESTEALVDNVSKWSMDFVLGVIPLKDGSKADCAQHVLGEIKTYTALYMEGRKINTLSDALTISYDISKSFIQNLGKGIKCISKNPAYLKFSKLANKLFGWDAWVSRTGTGLNISVGIGQWIYDNSSMELCYQVSGNDVQECEDINFSVDINNQTWQPSEVTLFDFTQDGQGIYLIAEDESYKFRGWVYNYNGIGTYTFPNTNINNTENYFRLTNKSTDITYTTFCGNNSVFKITAIDNLLVSATFDLKVCELNNENNSINLTKGIINLELTNP